ncbi:MAG: TspO/MBR family protein [Beijerinckiaceae bacterium]|nr:TspO/MBR family protein [Beijerinckiaceae bacterium]
MAAIAIGVVFVASAIGGSATGPNIPTWYASIQKPWFNPPNYVFGPVWTVLYIMLAFSFWRILRLPSDTPGRARAIGWFVVQISLNALWSVAFFGFQSPEFGLGVIAALLVVIVGNMIVFLRLDRIAGWMFAPYLAWVAFASVLNLAIVQLN